MAWLAYHPAPRRSAHIGSLPEPHHPVLSLTYGHTQTLRHTWTDFQATPAPPAAPPPSSSWPVGRGHVTGWNASRHWARSDRSSAGLPAWKLPAWNGSQKQRRSLFFTLIAALTLSSTQLLDTVACYAGSHLVPKLRTFFYILDLYSEFVRFSAEHYFSHFSEDLNHRLRVLCVFLLSKGQKLCIYLSNTASYSQPETPLYQRWEWRRTDWMQWDCCLYIYYRSISRKTKLKVKYPQRLQKVSDGSVSCETFFICMRLLQPGELRERFLGWFYWCTPLHHTNLKLAWNHFGEHDKHLDFFVMFFKLSLSGCGVLICRRSPLSKRMFQ